MISDLDKWLEELDAELASAPVQGESLVSRTKESNSVPSEEITMMIDLKATPAAADDMIDFAIKTVSKVGGEETKSFEPAMNRCDNDEAEPEMVDSALSGGSSKTSVPSLRSDDLMPPPPPPPSTEGEFPPAFNFDDWLNSINIEELKFANEEIYDSLVADLNGCNSEENTERLSSSSSMGRKSAEDGKNTAFRTPIMEALNSIYQPCNHLCYLNGFCTKPISGKAVMDLRNKYFYEEGIEAPKDKERGEIIMQYLRTARKDRDDNLIFVVDGHDVCTPSFLRILGVSSSPDITKAPGQWNRLMKGFLSHNNENLLSDKDLHIDAESDYTLKRGHVKAYINDVSQYFMDTLPTVPSEDGATHALQVPYGTIKAFFTEYEFHCTAAGIGKSERASYQTFVRAFNDLHRDGVVVLLGGKGGMNTCSLCNNVTAIKRSLCCKRDLVTRDALMKLSRLHLEQQATERQHAENYTKIAKNLGPDGQPIRAYFDIDGQSVWTGNTPKYSKDRLSKVDCCIENRNIGVRMVCGPIDEYIAVCTDNLIPGGANVLVEVVKYSMEHLGRRLSEFDMVMPKIVGLQFDNSGENKNKEMFCYLSHLIEDMFFTEIEIFFLIVGHTHNILDQWFSILAKAIKGAHFIGSVLALHVLYSIAHSDEEASKRPQHIHQLQIYHDFRRFYNPVRNTEIHNYNTPCRFKLTLDGVLKVCKKEYMVMSPPQGFKHMEKWQPATISIDSRSANANGDIPLTRLAIFNGAEAVCSALGLKGASKLTDAACATPIELEKNREFHEILPVLRELEVRCIGETALRMEHEAATGKTPEHINLTATQLKVIDNEITQGNVKQDGARIVWLRCSKADPNYLNGRPDVLPNPKLWRERMANAPKPPSPDQQPPLRLSKEETAKNKKLSLEAQESQQRLIAFQNGAADMASTATFVIKHVDDGCAISIAPHNDIVTATNNFEKLVLTPNEVAWYRSISTARQICALVEARALIAEAKPWKLLDLPEETPEQKKRRDERLQAVEKRKIEVEIALRKLVVRHGEGIYNPDLQVISMDGFKVAEKDDVANMNRAQLVEIAKRFKYTAAQIKVLKVEDLRKLVQDLVKDKNNGIQVPIMSSSTTGAASTSTTNVITSSSAEVVQIADTTIDDTDATEGKSTHSVDLNTDLSQSCSVLECDVLIDLTTNPTVWCDQCELYFCSELHGPHSSHDLQMLRSDRQRKKAREMVLESATVIEEAEISEQPSDSVSAYSLAIEEAVNTCPPGDIEASDGGTDGVTFDSVENTGITSTETQGAVVLNRLLNRKTKKIHSATNLSASPKRAALAQQEVTMPETDNVEDTVDHPQLLCSVLECEVNESDSGDKESMDTTTLPPEESCSVPSAAACDAITIINRCVIQSKSVTSNGPSKRDATAAALENTLASKMPTPLSSAAVALVPPLATAVESSQPNQLLTSSILSRSENDNVESRKRWEVKKFDKVVTFVREQLSSSQTDLDRILFQYLKYPACYDISFLQALAVEFEVDISEIVRKKRVSHKEAVNDLVNKLISK